MKTWFITGASTGLGREYALAALRRGDRVAAVSIDPENMTDYIEIYGNSAWVSYLDVTKKDMVQKVFDEAVKEFGQIDVCVNNAGYMQLGAVEEMSEEEARRLFDCNFFGTLFVTQAAAEHMRERRSGTILQTASLAAVDTIAGEGMYGAAKGAVLHMSQALYHELKPFGVRVVVVEPGPIKTSMAKRAKVCRNEIADYTELLRAETERWTGKDDSADKGDAGKCARLMLWLADCAQPPKQIVFTSFAHEILVQTAKERLKEAEEWRKEAAYVDL